MQFKPFKKAAVALTGAGLVLMAGPALAGGGVYDVEVGGSLANTDHAIEAYTTSPVDFSVLSSITGNPVNMGCDAGEVLPASGSVVHGGPSKLDLATIDGLDLINCVAAGGVAVNATVADGLKLHAEDDATVTVDKVDIVDGHIEGISAQVRSVIPGLCNFDVAGSVNGYYDENTDELVVDETGYDGDLEITFVSGCANGFAVGDPASFEATFSVEDGSGNPIGVNVQP